MATLTKEIFLQAEQQSFSKSYPEYVNSLLELGVERYTVSVSNHERRIFSGTYHPALELPGIQPTLHCSLQFDEKALSTALKRTQSGSSDYSTFMQEIAAAGVHFYIADLLNRTVSYFGKNPNQHYSEAIPQMQTH